MRNPVGWFIDRIFPRIAGLAFFVTLLLLIATVVSQVLCSRQGGLLDVFAPSTLAAMQKYSLIALRYVTPFVILPVVCYAAMYFFFDEMKSLTRSRTAARVLLVIAIVVVCISALWLWRVFFPSGVIQRYCLFQRPLVAVGEFCRNADLSDFLNVVIWGHQLNPLHVAIAVGVSALIAALGVLRDDIGKIVYAGAFGFGAFLSIVTGALAINLFSVFSRKNPDYTTPIDIHGFWGDVVPMIALACGALFCITFLVARIGWSVVRARSAVGKAFAFFWAVISAACVLLWIFVPFLFGFLLVPFVIFVIGLVLVIVFVCVYGKCMGEAAKDVATSSYESSSSDDTTTYKDSSGTEYYGSGSHPYTITSKSDGSSYDLGHDGKYHERYGNRTLES